MTKTRRYSHPSYLLTHAGHRDFDVYKNMQVKLRQLLPRYSWPLLACDSLPIHMTQLGSSLKDLHSLMSLVTLLCVLSDLLLGVT